MIELSILIPSRNEMFLKNTVEDALAHSNPQKTEIVAVLDGAWADPPIEDNPRVTLVYCSEPVGQRGACNIAAKLARGKWVMKIDAHCAFAPGFDEVMLADIQPDWTMVPIMRNLHAFDWVCINGHRRYQGISGPCTECGEPTTRDIVWYSKPSPQSKSYCFDAEPHFQYMGEFNHRPEGKGDLTETMSLQGSCWMLSKEKYFELGVCDETWGMWGSQGIEVAVKTWLSGGRVVVNHKTWYSHMFRTKGGDFGFPYHLSGRQVENAKKIARDLFFENKWPKQVRPLSWLVEKFWPVKGWSDEDLSRLKASEASLPNSRLELLGILGVGSSVPGTMADHTASVSVDSGGQEVAIPAMSLPELGGGSTISFENVPSIGDKSQMSGVAAEPIVADVIENGNISTLADRNRGDEPGIHEPMGAIQNFVDADTAIAVNRSPNPDPTSGIFVEANLGKDTIKSLPRNIADDKKIGVHTQIVSLIKGIVYYTDNRLDPLIMRTCQHQLSKSTNGHHIVSVSLSKIDFGENIVLPRQRGYLTMFEQILAGIERCNAEIVFFAEHDVLYPPSHFEFVPPDPSKFYYNMNVWKVDFATGHALRYDCKQTMALCGYREVLLKHYAERVRRTAEKLTELGDTREFRNWIRQQGFEPGTHGRAERVDDLTSETWWSEVPMIDIRHENNLTPSRWRQDQFRNSRSCRNWQEADEIPGWGITKDRAREFLESLGD